MTIILFFPLYQQLRFPFSVAFTLFNGKKSLFGRSRRLWNFVVPSTLQPDLESGLDGSVCLLLFIIVVLVSLFFYIHPTAIAFVFFLLQSIVIVVHKA